MQYAPQNKSEIDHRRFAVQHLISAFALLTVTVMDSTASLADGDPQPAGTAQLFQALSNLRNSIFDMATVAILQEMLWEAGDLNFPTPADFSRAHQAAREAAVEWAVAQTADAAGGRSLAEMTFGPHVSKLSPEMRAAANRFSMDEASINQILEAIFNR